MEPSAVSASQGFLDVYHMREKGRLRDTKPPYEVLFVRLEIDALWAL